jgi:hypothetical protein
VRKQGVLIEQFEDRRCRSGCRLDVLRVAWPAAASGKVGQGRVLIPASMSGPVRNKFLNKPTRGA